MSSVEKQQSDGSTDQNTPDALPLFRTTLFYMGILHLLLFLSIAGAEFVMVFNMENQLADRLLTNHSTALVWLNIRVLFLYIFAWGLHSLLIYPYLQMVQNRYSLRSTGRGIALVTGFLLLLILVTLFVYARSPNMLAPEIAGSLDQIRDLLGPAGGVMTSSTFAAWALLLPVCGSVLLWTRHRNTLSSLIRRLRNTRRRILIIAALLLPFIALGLYQWMAPSPESAPNNRRSPPQNSPNILILASDSLRGDHLGVNGYHRNTSPHMDRIADRGISFSNTFTPIGSTVESCVSLFSSTYPRTHGLRHMFPGREECRRVKNRVTFLTDLLEKRRNYQTRVISDWAGTNYRRIDAGFDRVELTGELTFNSLVGEVLLGGHPFVGLYGNNRVGAALLPELKSGSSMRSDEEVTKRTLDAIRRMSQKKGPFLIKSFFSCTHLPYGSPKPYHNLFTKPDYAGAHQRRVDFPSVDQFIKGGLNVDLDREDREQIIGLYDGTIRHFDDQVGRIHSYLKTLGLRNNTIIIVTSDHGDNLFEPGTTLGHGIGFEGGDQSNHVPFVISFPDRNIRSRTTDAMSRTIDIAPTLLDYLNIPVPDQWEGTSLMPYVENQEKRSGLSFYGETSYLFFRHDVPGEERMDFIPVDQAVSPDPEFHNFLVLKDQYRDLVMETKEYCLRTRNWKIIRSPGKGYTFWRLYHIREDPHCTERVEDRYPDVFRRMKKELNRWLGTGEETRFLDQKLPGRPGEPK